MVSEIYRANVEGNIEREGLRGKLSDQIENVLEKA